MTEDVKALFLTPSASIRDAMERLSRTRKGIVLVADAGLKLLGTVTDGDARRALLKGGTLDDAVTTAMQRRPFVVPRGTSIRTISALMAANGIAQVPVVDDAGVVVDVFLLDRVGRPEGGSAAVMAGGEGVRLRPLTETVPKPMLLVGGRPLLETIVLSLKAAGHTNIFIVVRYLADVIESHFGDGSSLGVAIHYLREPKALGTAGGLSLIPQSARPATPLLVVNGDLLTKLNFGALLDFHLAQGYAATICGRPYDVNVPFGYPVVNGDLVVEWREKPTFSYLVNSGIYCIDPDLLDQVPNGEPYSMPELVMRACAMGRRAGVFPLREPFHEIGQIDSYREAETFYQRHFASDP